jgi:hypothetical protein
MSAPLSDISNQTYWKTLSQNSSDKSGPWPGQIRSTGYIRTDSRISHTPSNPNSSTSFLVALRALKVIWGLLHRILGISRGFHSYPLGILQTLGGFLSPKVFPRFFKILQFFVDSLQCMWIFLL